MRMKPKIQNFFVAASLFVGALGLGGTAQAIPVTIEGNASSPTPPIGSLTYTAPLTGFSLSVPVGAGPTSLTDLGTFHLNGCDTTKFGNSCIDDFDTFFTDNFTLEITFTTPTVPGIPARFFTAEISGSIQRAGNSEEIFNSDKIVTIDFDNTLHHFTYSNGSGNSSGGFDVQVNDVNPIGPYTNSSSKFPVTRQVTGQILNLTQEFPGSGPGPGPDPSPVPEPSTFLMMFLGLLVIGRSVTKKWFSN